MDKIGEKTGENVSMKSQKRFHRILTLLVAAGLMAGSALAASTATRRTIEVEYAKEPLISSACADWRAKFLSDE